MNLIRGFSRRQKILALIVLILIVGNGIRFLRFDNIVLPTQSRIDREQQTIKQTRTVLSNLNKEKDKRRENKERLRSLTKDFWSTTEKAATNQVQLKIERLGRKTGITLKNVGAPKLIELSDNVNAVDVTVSSTTSIKEFSKFLREIQNHNPKLIWNNCVIRPNRMKSPTAINISGKIRAFILAKSASEYLQQEQELE